MSEVFRTRRFEPVAPADRPHRSRRAARVVITDTRSVLLLADTDPGLPETRWWVTPGGGIDPGETPAEAAVREIAEETGLVIEATQLLGPVLDRDVLHGYSDQILSQHEDFYILVLPEPFEVSPAGLTPDEQITLKGSAWHRIDDLPGLADPVWPSDLAAVIGLAERPSAWPVHIGTIEESTLPVN